MLIKELSRISAICELDPTASFRLTKDNVIKNWTSSVRDQPTDEEIQIKYNELKDKYDSQSYARSRLEEYPNLHDCIHALLDGGNTLTELQAKRAEVKAKYPKPSE